MIKNKTKTNSIKLKAKIFNSNTIGRSKSIIPWSGKNNTSPELSDLLKQPYIGHDKLMTLIRRYKLAKNKNKKQQLRDEIFRNNVRFIRKAVLSKVSNYPERVEDTFNAAVISFFEGLDKFKPNRGFKFHTYIGFWVNKAIYQEYVSSNIINIPRGDFFNKDSDSVNAARNNKLVFLDKPLLGDTGPGEKNITMLDVFEDKFTTSATREADEFSEQLRSVKIAMNQILHRYEYTLVYWRYFCNPSLTLDEISNMAGCSRERCRQIIFLGTWKIKKFIESDGEFKYVRKSGENTKLRKNLDISDEEMRILYEKTISNRVANPPKDLE